MIEGIYQLIALIFGVLIMAGAIAFRLWSRNQWLSHRIEAELSRQRTDTLSSPPFNQLSLITTRISDTLSSSRGFLLVLLIIALPQIAIYLLNPSLASSWFDSERISEFLAVLWQVQASFLGITFVVAVFLIQSILTPQQREEGVFRYYLRESRIVALAYWGIGTLVSLGVLYGLTIRSVLSGGQTSFLVILNLLFWFITLFLTARLYWRSLEFLSPKFLDRAVVRVVQSGIEQSIQFELARRASEGILEDTCNSVKIVYDTAPSLARIPARPVYAKERGQTVIRDINLKRVERLGKLLSAKSPASDMQRAWIVKGYGARLFGLNTPIGYILESAYTDEAVSLLQSCFKTHASSAAEDISDQLSFLRARITEAIRANQGTEIEKLVQVYVEAITSFIKAVQQYDIRYTTETVRYVSSLDWPPLSQIERDIYDLLRQSFRQDEPTVIAPMIFLPFKVMQVSLEYKDHFIFRMFASYFPFIFWEANRTLTGKSTLTYILDRSWRHLSDFCRYNLESRIRSLPEGQNDLSEISEFVIDIVMIFNRLMRTAIDLSDYKSFQKFGSAMDNLFAAVIPSPFPMDANQQRLELQVRLAAQPDEREHATQALDDYLENKRLLQRITQAKVMVWFGVASWLFDLYRREQVQNEIFLRFYQPVTSHFADIGGLADAFVTAKQEHAQSDTFGWSGWDLEKHPEEPGRVRAYGIAVDNWLTWFFVLRALSLLREPPSSTRRLIPIQEGTSHQIDEIRRICNEIRSGSDKWRDLFPLPELDQRVAYLIALYERAKQENEQREQDELIAQDLSENKINEFITAFHNAWEKEPILRNIIRRFGTFVDLTKDPTSQRGAGYQFDKLFPKQPFVEQDHAFIGGTGEVVARELADSEDAAILSALENQLAEPWAANSFGDARTLLDRAINSLRDGNYEPSVILAKGGEQIEDLMQSRKFVPFWQEGQPAYDIAAYQGTYDNIPIFLWPSDQVIEYNVIDLNSLGHLSQFAVPDAGDQQFRIQVTKIDDVLANELVARNPDLMRRDNSGNDRSDEQVAHELKQHVLLHIAESYEFKVTDPNAGIRITMSQANDNQITAA